MKKIQSPFHIWIVLSTKLPIFPKKYPLENTKSYRNRNTHTKLEEKIKTIKKWNGRRNEKDTISNIYISLEKNEELYSKLVCVRGLIKNMNNFKMQPLNINKNGL